MNVFEPKIFFKREAIADTGIWVAKKRYAMNVWDNEGVRYKTPKLKVMGLEIVRSSTPAPIRESLKEAVSLCLNAGEKELQNFVEESWQASEKWNQNKWHFPVDVTTLVSIHLVKRCTPRELQCMFAALVYNHLVKTQKIENKYQIIQDGDKIKYLYLKEPNHIRENCVGFNGIMPKEFDLHRYIDYELMFEKLS